MDDKVRMRATVTFDYIAHRSVYEPGMSPMEMAEFNVGLFKDDPKVLFELMDFTACKITITPVLEE